SSPEAGAAMPTVDEYLSRSLVDRLLRLEATCQEIGAAFDGKSEALIGRRPDSQNWSAREIVCHLRDVEELFLIRFQTLLAIDDPKILTCAATPDVLAQWGIGDAVGHPLDPARWAEERQYARCDARLALDAFRRRRGEVLALLDALSPDQWQRGGIHLIRG